MVASSELVVAILSFDELGLAQPQLVSLSFYSSQSTYWALGTDQRSSPNIPAFQTVAIILKVFA